MVDRNANGCIMADGMGLGKTVGWNRTTKYGLVADPF